jgi:serine O-acetyltransferase
VSGTGFRYALEKIKVNAWSFKKFLETVWQDRCNFPGGVTKGGFLRLLFLYPGFRFVLLLRLCRYLRWHPLLKLISPFFILCFWRMQRVYGLSLSYGAEVGSGLYIPHIGLGVINPAAKIGKNLYLSQGVTVGKTHTGPKAGSPTIGHGVFLGPNACVFGNITLGDNCAVGANSVVLDDVPSGVTVAGAPAEIISQKGADVLLGKKVG